RRCRPPSRTPKSSTRGRAPCQRSRRPRWKRSIQIPMLFPLLGKSRRVAGSCASPGSRRVRRLRSTSRPSQSRTSPKCRGRRFSSHQFSSNQVSCSQISSHRPSSHQFISHSSHQPSSRQPTRQISSHQFSSNQVSSPQAGSHQISSHVLRSRSLRSLRVMMCSTSRGSACLGSRRRRRCPGPLPLSKPRRAGPRCRRRPRRHRKPLTKRPAMSPTVRSGRSFGRSSRRI
ncbi:unnamed protein product, partial [Prorocentrum cordatum]